MFIGSTNHGLTARWISPAKILGVFLTLSLLLTQSSSPVLASGTIRYVTPTGLNSGTCSTWAAACNLQRALAVVAVSGDQLWVKQGTYKPTTPSGRDATFTLKNGVKIYGGFAGTETKFSQRNPKTHITILSGDIGTPGVATDNAYHVLTGGGLSTTTVLDGFTVKSGNANGGSSNDWGAGMFNAGSNPTLMNVIFTGNSADYGGGMFNYISSPVLTNVTFSNNKASTVGGGMFTELGSTPVLKNVNFSSNSAPNGAGMYNEGVSPSLTSVTFSGNTASDSGGGMYNDSVANPTLTNVIFNGNSASTAGGGIYNTSSSPNLSQVTFTGNFADNGGGIYNTNGSGPTLTNVTFHGNSAVFGYGGGMFNSGGVPILTNITFSGNSATVDGGAIHNDGSSPRIYESIFWSDGTEITSIASSGAVYDSILSGGGCPTGASCLNIINSNPHLGPLANNGGYTKTMALGAGSAAIDAGGVNISCAATDQRGVSRIEQGLACDIGAYEVKALTLISTAAYDGWMLESAKGSNVGGSKNSSASTLNVGDNSANRRYRGVLSFNTAQIPDASSVVLAQIRVTQQSITGNPFATQGTLLVDLVKPYFGSSFALAVSDYQAAATVNSAGSFVPALGTYWSTLNGNARLNINKTGTTQFRLRFNSEGYNGAADYLSLYSGSATTAVNRPLLFVYYNP